MRPRAGRVVVVLAVSLAVGCAAVTGLSDYDVYNDAPDAAGDGRALPTPSPDVGPVGRPGPPDAAARAEDASRADAAPSDAGGPDAAPTTDAATDARPDAAETFTLCPNTGPLNGHCYFLAQTPMPQDFGKQTCAFRGAHLATISSAAENAFLAQLSRSRDAWIGLEAQSPSNNPAAYQWVNGEASTYTNWYTDNPNAEGRCVCFYVQQGNPTARWADRPCNELNQVLCEHE